MNRACLLLLLAGCAVIESPKYKTNPANPFPDIQVVAVFPFLNLTSDARLDTEEYGNVFASEWLKFEGFRIVRPALVKASMETGETLRSVDDALRVARRLRADALVVAALTDFDPYSPPKVAVSVQFFRASGRSFSDSEIDRIVQSASWVRGPLGVPRERAGHWVTAFEKVFDAHQDDVRAEIVAYAQAQEGSDTPFTGEREFLSVSSRYMQFVSNLVIRQILQAGKKQAE